jgi:aldehyde:ferredoxin oxidoreductase
MLYGWTGKRLIVDLSSGKTGIERISEEMLHRFIGGRGLNSATLFNEIAPDADPLGPENILLFGVGPCNGTLIPGSSRMTLTALSPSVFVGNDRPGLGDANSGGFWGAELKFAGFDQVKVIGRSERPVYLWINDQQAEIRDARHLWGKDVWETQQAIRSELGVKEAKVAAIGPAGENLSRMACVINDQHRAAGRCGMGAVMGSKHLKALVIRGTGQVPVADKAAIISLLKESKELLFQDRSSLEYSKQGSLSLLTHHQRLGRLATRNYQETQFAGWQDISASAMEEKGYWKGSKGCRACPLHCTQSFRLDEGRFKGTWGDGPEYVTMAGFGSKCGNHHLESILQANMLCNRLGLDTESTSSTIAWAMECWEKGLLGKKDTDGLDLGWGNHESILSLISQIAYRKEPLGNLLAEGAYTAAKRIGKDSLKYVSHVKGQDPAITDPRASPLWGLAYAVSSRGGDHLRALPTVENCFSPEEAEKLFRSSMALNQDSVEGKGYLVKWCEDNRAVADSLEVCKFIVRTVLLKPIWMTRYLQAVTGGDLTEDELMTTGARIVNVERLFNIRQGLTRKDDTLPERFLTEPIPSGPQKGKVLNLQPMLDEYYKARGWDLETGRPTKACLMDLGLADMGRDDVDSLSQTW